MSQFYKKAAPHLVVSFLIVGALAIGVSFFGKNIHAYSAEISKNREEFMNRSHRLQTFAILKGDYEKKAKGYLATLRRFIPERDDLINIREEFRFLSDQMGLSSSLQFTGEIAPGENGIGSLKFILSLGGDPQKLFLFTQSLERFRYLVQVEGVTLDRGANNKGEMKIKGHVFFRKNI